MNLPVPTLMSGYIDYVLKLEDMALTGYSSHPAKFEPALNGEAGNKLRQLVKLPSRRRFGAFFTGSELATRLLKQGSRTGKYCDPNCGAGDLLLAAARWLTIKPSLRETITHWAERLQGFDIHPEFVRAAKARLVLLARDRGAFTEALRPAELATAFPLIQQTDAMEWSGTLSANMLVMNPPYFVKQAPDGCLWGSGNVNYAAVFVEKFLAASEDEVELVAILPEVLRAGSNYRKWRERIADLAGEIRVESWGLFDANADVDVFSLRVKRNFKGGGKWPAVNVMGPLGNQFEVSVGSVVPHRHKQRGTLRRYLDARSAPSFGTVKRVKKKRRFEGPVVSPPFVTIKRTSRPGDKHRAIGTVVTGKGAVAVENHLIVCRPKDGTIRACEQLVEKLKAPKVTRALDRSIRCRHLTVGAVRSINVT